MGIGLESIFSSKKIQLDKFSPKGNYSLVAGTLACISKEKKLKIVLVGVPYGNMLVLSYAGKTYIKKQLRENHLFLKGKASVLLLQL